MYMHEPPASPTVLVDATNRTSDQFREDLAAARASATGPLAVTIDAGGGHAEDPARFQAFAQRLVGTESGVGVSMITPHFQEDALAAKLAVLVAHPVAVVAFTAGLPPRHAVEALHAVGSQVWIAAASREEADRAAALGADALLPADERWRR
jgi:nitronate monooxygenase